MLRTLLRRYGVVGSTALLTVASIAISLIITASVNLLSDGTVGVMGLIVAVVAPALISPIFGGWTLRLAQRLDVTQEQLRHLAITDELTQAHNRRYFFEVAEQELARVRRSGEVFSVVILDMDDFKHINDTYGHLVGDDVLRTVSAVCIANARAMDTFARYGGEEFVFLLPRMNRAAALTFCGRVQRALSEARLVEQGRTIQFSASIGVATFEPTTADVYSLISQADRALYAAKSRGKNSIMASPEVT